jgi:hypothetical protein
MTIWQIKLHGHLLHTYPLPTRDLGSCDTLHCWRLGLRWPLKFRVLAGTARNCAQYYALVNTDQITQLLNRLTQYESRCRHVCMHVCIYVCVCMYVCMYMCVCVCVCVYVCKYVSMYVCMYVFMYYVLWMYVCMLVYMYACMHAFMHTCMYVCMYVCMCIAAFKTIF